MASANYRHLRERGAAMRLTNGLECSGGLMPPRSRNTSTTRLRSGSQMIVP